MAGAVQQVQQQIQNQSITAAVQKVHELDTALDALKLRALNDFRELKAHPERLADLTVTDGDWQLMPSRPAIQRKTKEAAS